jgi:hypothetical protein
MVIKTINNESEEIETEFNELATKMKPNSWIKIAKVNVEEFNGHGIQINSFPAVYFFKKSGLTP